MLHSAEKWNRPILQGARNNEQFEGGKTIWLSLLLLSL